MAVVFPFWHYFIRQMGIAVAQHLNWTFMSLLRTTFESQISSQKDGLMSN